MRILKSGLMAAGALALAAMLLNFVAPKSVHAAVAALVQVENTSANPVPNRDVDAPGRNAYVLTCSGGASCYTPLVPTGYTFVVDSVSAQFANSPFPVLNVQVQTRDQLVALALPATQIAPSSYVLANPTSIYVDGSSALLVNLAPAAGSAIYTVVFEGHLVSTP